MPAATAQRLCPIVTVVALALTACAPERIRPPEPTTMLSTLGAAAESRARAGAF